MLRSRELRWGIATASMVSLTLFAVPAWSPLYADGQRSSAAVEQSTEPRAERTDDETDDETDETDERGECRLTDDAPTVGGAVSASGEAAAPSGSRAQALMVRTPATAMIRVDAGGAVIAAWTNTGCAPSAAHDLWVQHPDGTITPAPTSIVERPWRGDFSQAGVFVDQRIGPDASHDD